ncbi:MAG: S41 family peptidase [Patescibacteria group bacterium]
MTFFYQRNPKNIFFKRFLAVYGLLAVLLLVFVGGAWVGASAPKVSAQGSGGKVEQRDALPPYLLQDVDFKLFWDVWSMVKSKYLEQPVPDTRLFYGALSGIVASLGDPYSIFLDPEISKKFNDELSGTFDGIGAEIGIKKDRLLIVAPLPSTPAERAGLRSGDSILTIDGKDTTGMSVEQAVTLIRGPKGSKVTLKVYREGWEETQEKEIDRETIHIQNVTWKMVGDVAYIKIVQFNGDTVALFGDAAREVILKKPKGIVLDLRNNPGGYFDGAVAIASYWVTAGDPVVLQKGKSGEKQAFVAEGNAPFSEMPTVVLVNGGSASAAEIVAGAMQDQGKATLIGEQTFGKGSVQDFEGLSGGSAIKITVAEWLTPKGRSINKEGIKPDVEVKFSKEDYENDRDPQLDRAVQSFQGKPLK